MRILLRESEKLKAQFSRMFMRLNCGFCADLRSAKIRFKSSRAHQIILAAQKIIVQGSSQTLAGQEFFHVFSEQVRLQVHRVANLSLA